MESVFRMDFLHIQKDIVFKTKRMEYNTWPRKTIRMLGCGLSTMYSHILGFSFSFSQRTTAIDPLPTLPGRHVRSILQVVFFHPNVFPTGSDFLFFAGMKRYICSCRPFVLDQPLPYEWKTLTFVDIPFKTSSSVRETLFLR